MKCHKLSHSARSAREQLINRNNYLLFNVSRSLRNVSLLIRRRIRVLKHHENSHGLHARYVMRLMRLCISQIAIDTATGGLSLRRVTRNMWVQSSLGVLAQLCCSSAVLLYGHTIQQSSVVKSTSSVTPRVLLVYIRR